MSSTPPHAHQSQEEQPVLFYISRNENGYLSNMYLADFVYEDGRKFNCVEQFFHAAKAELFGDHSALEQIMNVRSGKKQKELGRKVKGFVESEWTAVSIDVMRRGVLAKFSYRPNQGIRQQLLDTGNRLLIEASPYDTFWGCGWSAETFYASPSKDYPGRNELGKVLMEVRDILREKEGSETHKTKANKARFLKAKKREFRNEEVRGESNKEIEEFES